jgi:molybdopterin-guanine dinucleotide biosynthesis protein A/GNAT superfamily N-acetyltransferase
VAPGGLTGVLLVGGASRRFGSPKALAELDGETLAERAWRILGDACDERIAVGKTSDGIELPFPIVDDGTEVRAPIAGVVAGLRAATNGICVVIPVDMPFLTPDLLRALARACDDADAAITRRGLPVALRAGGALPVLERRLERGDLALHDAFDQLDWEFLDVDPERLENVNTEERLAAVSARRGARAAAVEAAGRFGLDASEARILSDWNDTIVHLAPSPVVARVKTTWIAGDAEASLDEELRVAAEVVARGGPVVPPTRDPPPGPHVVDGLVLTFWEYAQRVSRRVEPQEAGRALRGLHDALAPLAGSLPPLSRRLDRAQAAVEDARAVAALAEHDRRFLARALRELRDRIERYELPVRALHGGPHESNLLDTPGGPRWIDLDTACVGPLEWDLAHLPGAAAQQFPEANPRALADLRLLVSADVAVWCWHTYGRADEVDEAAGYHLGLLQDAFREPTIVTLTSAHVPGFIRLVEETLPEFGFSRDSAHDVDLAAPLSYYAAAWVVVEGDRVVGSVALHDLGGGTLELKRMYLRSDVRRRGLGRRLLEVALGWARDQGAQTIRLDTTEQMEAARHLYEAYGFVRVPGEAPRQGQRRLLYELRIDA